MTEVMFKTGKSAMILLLMLSFAGCEDLGLTRYGKGGNKRGGNPADAEGKLIVGLSEVDDEAEESASFLWNPKELFKSIFSTPKALAQDSDEEPHDDYLYIDKNGERIKLISFWLMIKNVHWKRYSLNENNEAKITNAEFVQTHRVIDLMQPSPYSVFESIPRPEFLVNHIDFTEKDYVKGRIDGLMKKIETSSDPQVVRSAERVLERFMKRVVIDNFEADFEQDPRGEHVPDSLVYVTGKSESRGWFQFALFHTGMLANFSVDLIKSGGGIALDHDLNQHFNISPYKFFKNIDINWAHDQRIMSWGWNNSQEKEERSIKVKREDCEPVLELARSRDELGSSLFTHFLNNPLREKFLSMSQMEEYIVPLCMAYSVRAATRWGLDNNQNGYLDPEEILLTGTGRP